MNYMEVARKIVNVFYLKRERSEDYVVRIDCAPNPLDYDGMNSVSASVVRTDRIDQNFNAPKAETLILRSGYALTIEEALAKLGQAAGVAV